MYFVVLADKHFIQLLLRSTKWVQAKLFKEIVIKVIASMSVNQS